MVASGREELSRRTIGTPIWLAIVLILSLVANAIALIVAASTPSLDGAVTALLVASVVLGAAVAVTVAFAVVHKRRRTTNNGNWVYW
jgi:NADH:ubiquinone oxidoreductase subunit K